MKIQVAGENSLIIYFAEEASPEVAERVRAVNDAIQQHCPQLIVDTIPSYASLLIVFDALHTDQFHVRNAIKAAVKKIGSGQVHSGTLVTIPVYYSEESGPDLTVIAQRSGLSIDDVIQIHQALKYRVYAIGFAPGFAYLGQVDERIAAPRISTPRKYVPKGAVGIADRQTAVYPAPSPGGWNLIGISPMPMFTPQADSLMPVQVGDTVKFEAISKQRFLELGGELDNKFMEQEAQR